MARETLKDFLRSGDYAGTAENAEGVIQYTLDSLVSDEHRDSSGLGVDINTGLTLVGFDAEDPNSGLVGSFLRYAAKEAGNFYEFKPGNQETVAGNRGDYLLDADTFLAVPSYVQQGSRQDQEISKFSNSGYFNNPVTPEIDELFDIISKVDGAARGAGENAPRGANDLLKDVFIPASSETTAESDFVVKATVEALKRNNRFNMEDDYLDGQSSSAIDEKEEYQFMRGEDEFRTSLEKLKDVGASLMLKASGHDLTNFPINMDGYIEAAEAAVIDGVQPAMPANIPGEDGDFPKLSTENILGMNATGVPNNGTSSVRKGTGVQIDYTPGSQNAETFGVLYNQSLRFEDITDAHKVKTALRLITLFTLVESVYKEIIESISRDDVTVIADEIKKIAVSPNIGNAGIHILGQARKSNKFIASNFLFDNFLTPTDFPYSECFNRGVKVLFLEKPEKSTANNTAKHLHKTYNSPGFWLAIANSAIKKTFLFTDTIKRMAEVSSAGTGPQDAIREMIKEFGSVAKIANIIAIIGEKSLHHTNAATNVSDVTKKVANARDPDSLDNIPGNRVGKSRKKKNASKGDIGSKQTLAWEQSSVPSSYLLPLNIVRAASDLNNGAGRINPMRGMLGSRLIRNTYTGLDTDGTNARIPGRVVKILEDRLDAEYVPFYFHDLRTNEIISFHAFLTQLTDSITPVHTKTQAYGRIDPVLTYGSTTRRIQVGFTVYATNKEDFDDMWFKINKLVTMLYPQYTQGQMVQVGEEPSGGFFSLGSAKADHSRFIQPFTQAIGASPIIRLRVGDVIKSNYSRFALARTFGIGDQGVKANAIDHFSVANFLADIFRGIRDISVTILGAVMGSPVGLANNLADLGASKAGDLNSAAAAAVNIAADAVIEEVAEHLINGFVSPLAVMLTNTIDRLRDPNVYDNGGYTNGPGFVYINPNMIDGYQSKSGKRFFTSKRVLGSVKKKVKDETGNNKIYEVEVVDRSDSNLEGEVLLVSHQNVWNDPSETFTKSTLGFLFLGATVDFAGIIDAAASSAIRKGGSGGFFANIGAELAGLILENPESQFMRPEVNPFVRAFHTTRGRGLAGAMDGITFNWLDDFPWETDHNSRAPIGCQIGFAFDVIHDLPPGLDHTGYNRAPLYNVGEIMRNVAGDVYEDRFSKSEKKFRQGGATKESPGKTSRHTGKKK